MSRPKKTFVFLNKTFNLFSEDHRSVGQKYSPTHIAGGSCLYIYVLVPNLIIYLKLDSFTELTGSNEYMVFVNQNLIIKV